MDSSSELIIPENAEQEEDESTENVGIAEADSTQVYSIRPKLEEKFKPLSAKEIIHNVLFDQLSTRVYNSEEAHKWCKEISDLIREKVKKLGKQYKYVVNVIIGEKNGAGAKIGCRCVWDTECDTFAYDSFTNETLFCVAAVYALFNY
ncbi:hypothetical protein QAD02_010628 [Eretmocerus hayati]|uniref:Uncharacterized protein n=1 Tax=Eretmocerus hayati TaxID=131215 RepID=A0ACC2NUM8_9HYME|nr:hypothetical protein QAD02_010628 [Eretmocerus hayati]